MATELASNRQIFEGLVLRRGLSIVLMLGYLATQLAAVPHAHGLTGENQPAGHSHQPHIHVSWFEHDGHHHDVGHTHRHGGEGSHSHPASSDSHQGNDDHDSDAVYLPNDTGASLPSKGVVSPDSLELVSTLCLAAIPAPTAISECFADAYSPDKCSPSRPLYLALRALRI